MTAVHLTAGDGTGYLTPAARWAFPGSALEQWEQIRRRRGEGAWTSPGKMLAPGAGEEFPQPGTRM